jgi:non-specific serine/threonine protein kinase
MAHNLPSRLTSFVGREREIAEVCALVRAGRLVTLVGAPGVGKTRLSLQIAAGVVDRFPDGAWLVELAPLSDPMLVPQAVANVLGVREQPGRPLADSIADWLRAHRLLLLLDNCEHLIGAAASLVDGLVQSCPDLHVLATSREPLAIEGEVTYRVPSLTVAEAESEAARLFVERAQAAAPSFVLTDRNSATVVRICARLDGIPLAIELAAARVRALSVEQIAARLDDRFRLLTGGSRTALPRQQTLRGAIDWSYDLLSDPERTLLRRLAVFAGGFTLEAAEAILDGGSRDEGRGTSELDPNSSLDPHPSPVDVLVSLVDKSLVQVDEDGGDGGGRYRLLETLREYGLEKLAEHCELATVRSWYRDYFLAFAEQIGPALNARVDGSLVTRLEREHDNLRTALSWCLDEPASEPGDAVVAQAEQRLPGAALGVRLAASIWRLWWLRGQIDEGRRWLERVLAMPTSDTSPTGRSARAMALLGLANLSAFQGDYRAAVDHMTENLEFCRETGNDLGVVRALNRLGFYLAHLGEAERGADLCAESVALGRRMGDPATLASSLHSAAHAALILGQWEESFALAEEAIALFRQVGNATVIAYDLRVQGLATAKLGDPVRATQLAEEGMRISQEVGDRRGIGCSYKDLGHYALLLGDVDRAVEQLRMGIALFNQIGDRWLGSICIALLGKVKIEQVIRVPGSDLTSTAQTDRARASLLETARLFAAGEIVREQDGLGLPSDLIGTYDRDVAVLRELLGKAELARAWAEGRAMSFEQAVAYALAITAPAAPTATDAGPAPVVTGDPEAARLTPREGEVARLILQGRTNREIAEALVLSERTVDSHVRNIMGKLEVNSRARIAAWAVQHGFGDPR